MRKNFFFVNVCALFFALVLTSSAHAESSEVQEIDPIHSYRCEQMSMGFGLGVDYGFAGTNINLFFNPYVGVFGGIGFLGHGLGTNAGLRFRVPNLFGSRYVAASMLGCYGTNAILRSEDKFFTDVQKFSGFTFGLGFDVKLDKKSLNYWTLMLTLPQVSDRYKKMVDQYDWEKNSPPLVLSIGYKFGFSDLK